jgi:LCP family protein required for cell wall assembly
MRKSFKVLIYSFLILILLSIAYLGFIFYKANRAWADVQNKNDKTADIDYRLPVVGEANNSGLYIDGVVLDDGSPRLNILLLGNGGANHPGGMLTDSIQIFSYNTQNQKAALISLPRDLYVEIEDQGSHKLNEGLQIGLAKGIGGDAMKNTVSKILGIPIQKFFDINFYGFRSLVDSLDGIDVYVDKALTDYEPGNEFSITAGWHHMNGELALKYSRSRKTTSDFDRSRRQQKVMGAIKQKMTDWKIFVNISKVQSLLNTVSQNIKTDLGLNDISSIIQKAENIDFNKINRVVIDNSSVNHLLYSTTSYGGSYILLPYGGNFKQVREYVKKYLP